MIEWIDRQVPHIAIHLIIIMATGAQLHPTLCNPMDNNPWGGTVVKKPHANAGDAGDPGSIPRSGRAPGEGNDIPLQYSCLGNPMDRGA